MFLSLAIFNPSTVYAYHRWGWGFGAGFIGGAIVARPYYQPYFPGPVIVQQPPVVYVSPPPAHVVMSPPTEAIPQTPLTPPPPPGVVSSSPGATWYYCDSEKNFYPNVATCPEPWKPIPVPNK